MTRPGRPILFGLLVAAAMGVLAAILLVSPADPHASVMQLLVSPDPTRRQMGWEIVDEITWTQDQHALLEQALLAAPAEATIDAAEHPWFQPRQHQAAFAELIAPSNPRRALGWMASTDPLLLQDWRSTAITLLGSPQADIREETVAVISRNISNRGGLHTLLEHVHPQGIRQKAVLSFVSGLQKNGPRTLLEDIGVLFETDVDKERIRAAARQIILRKRTDIELRRYAAWRLDPLDDGTAAGLLAPAPADVDGSVMATAMIAYRHLSRKACEELVERWLVDFEVDRRRSAAILMVLNDTDSMVLQTALAREKDPGARRTMNLALLAMDAWPHTNVDPEEYFARTMRLKDGRRDPDSAFLHMLSGDPEALAALASPPQLPTTGLSERDRQRWRRAIQWRQWALARMVPEWHQILGEPVAGDEDGILRRLDMIEALRLTHGEDLTWDPVARCWLEVARSTPEKDHVSP